MSGAGEGVRYGTSHPLPLALHVLGVLAGFGLPLLAAWFCAAKRSSETSDSAHGIAWSDFSTATTAGPCHDFWFSPGRRRSRPQAWFKTARYDPNLPALD